jgi:hypothetical protein
MTISINSENRRIMVIRLDKEIWEIGKGGTKSGCGKSVGEERSMVAARFCGL